MSTSSTGAGNAGEEFDQTNAMAGDTTGESGATADGELRSAAERDDDADRRDEERLGDSDPAGPAILPRVLGDDNEL